MINTLLVEGEHDVAYVRAILSRIGVEQDAMTVRSAGGKRAIASELRAAANQSSPQIAALVDLDQPSIYDARVEAAKQLGVPQDIVFAAVPTIEAWLFADVTNALSHARNKVAQAVIQRLPLPEEIPYPKHVALNVFREAGKGRYSARNLVPILNTMDMGIAVSRSPSLRQFVEAFVPFDTLAKFSIAPTYARSMSRDALSNLVEEVAPSTATIYRTMDGVEVSASEMTRAIREGSPRGQQYASDLLRIARDLLANMAQDSTARGFDQLEKFSFDDE